MFNSKEVAQQCYYYAATEEPHLYVTDIVDAMKEMSLCKRCQAI